MCIQSHAPSLFSRANMVLQLFFFFFFKQIFVSMQFQKKGLKIELVLKTSFSMFFIFQKN